MTTAAKRWMRRVRAPLEVAGIKLGMAIVPRLPRRVLLGLARSFGTLGYVFSPSLRRLGFANLDVAFGSTLSPREKRTILKRSMRNFSLVLLDLFWFSRHARERMERYVQVAPSLVRLEEATGPVVGLTAHYGNWEMAGRRFGMTKRGLMSVAMPVKNATAGRLLQQARECTGQCIVERQGALKKLIRHLRANGTVGLLLDQNTKPSEGGIFVHFFGKPATISPAAGSLALATGADIVFAHFLPDANGHYLGEAPRWITAAEIAALPRADAIAILSQRIAGFYEEAIRLHPDYWLWSYKRWRYIPDGTPAAGFPSYAQPVPAPPGKDSAVDPSPRPVASSPSPTPKETPHA